MTFSSSSPRSRRRCGGRRSRDRSTDATRRSILSATFSLLSSTPREFPQQQRLRSIALGGPCAVRRSEFSGSDDPLQMRTLVRAPWPNPVESGTSGGRHPRRARGCPTERDGRPRRCTPPLVQWPRFYCACPCKCRNVFPTHHTTQRIVVFDGLLMEQRWRLPSSGGLLPSRVRIANPSASRCSAVPVADAN